MAITELPIVPSGEIRAPSDEAATSTVRLYFGVLALLSLGAFVFGFENRFISYGAIRVPPPVDWIPPLSAQEWSEAFAIHQRDPVFAACGGTESLALFRVLYWWEWLQRASLVALATSAVIGFYCACAWQRFRFVLPQLGGLALLVLICWIARSVIELSTRGTEVLSTFNVGQYRHAIDVTFASAAAAVVLASAVVPPAPGRVNIVLYRIDRTEWLWIAIVLVDICFGGLFTGRNAAAFWPTWPGYEGHLLPPLEQLISYSPWWLNFTSNPYTIQLVHRTLSGALWIAALWQLIASMLRANHLARSIVRFVLITVQMFAGVATLLLIAPAALLTVHQVGPIFMLAASLVFSKSSQGTADAAPTRGKPRGRVHGVDDREE
jgi:cytochrome c oxidase assembly protein subunit 15